MVVLKPFVFSLYILSPVFCSFLALGTAARAEAQSIVLTGPTSNQTVQEGDDYATTVLQNAWDFTERRDVGWEESYVGSSVSANGIWQGTNEGTGAYFFPLFGGYKGGLFAEGIAGDTSLPRLGINHPIDTSKYTMLAYSLYNTSRSTYAIYWNNNTTASHWPDGSNNCVSYDGFYNYANAHANSGYNVYSFDLSARTGCDQSAGSWSGNVVALRVDPSTAGPAGSKTYIDWMRLVDPDSAPTVNITWNSSSLPSEPVITVWADTNSSGYDGIPIARYAYGSNPGVHPLKTALLPPGRWYFYLTVHAGSSLTQYAQSNYSARLQINAAPKVTISSPSEITGDDYATTELGNPWDMSSTEDLSNLSAGTPAEWQQFSNPVMANGEFTAVANPPLVGNTESDAQIHLNVQTNKPIDTSRYRYLTYRLWLDDTNYPTIANKVEHGWVARPVAWRSDLFGDGFRPAAHVVYEGYHTYTIDLWDIPNLELGLPWDHNTQLQHMRVDPMETTDPTTFKFDYVMLTQENQASDGVFNVEWTLTDDDSQQVSTAIYYDSDNSGFDGTLIANLGSLAPGSQSYQWNTSGVAEGEYYVYLVMNDGYSTRQFYSSVPIRVGDFPIQPQLANLTHDYDGDGKSDLVVYRPSFGGVFFTNGSVLGQTTMAWGGTPFRPIHGDFDGDGRSDYGVVVLNGAGYLDWYISRSSDNALYSRSWGLSGDLTVIGDYNGDGKDDIAIYRAGWWYIIYDTGEITVVGWGVPGDAPVPGDYDGDGKDDVAIWRPSDGMWWVLHSGFPTHADNYYRAVQWGLPGDVPVPGDFNSDGKLDHAIWRPSEGNWYIRDLVQDSYSVTQWGLPGDVPLVGDFNGDRVLDLAVNRSFSWFINYRNGSTDYRQWGLPGLDYMPNNVMNPLL